MAACLPNNDTDDKKSTCDTDDDDDYEDFCENFTFSVSFTTNSLKIYQTWHLIVYPSSKCSVRHHVACAMVIMGQPLANHCVVHAMHFCFR